MGDMQTDPSMEEILASIKRVIAEDNRAQPARARERRSRPNLNRQTPLPTRMCWSWTIRSPSMAACCPATRRRRAAPASPPCPRCAASRRRSPTPSPLEAVVRDMLRPMLKEWLDENLPEIVESLVTREIARITGRKL